PAVNCWATIIRPRCGLTNLLQSPSGRLQVVSRYPELYFGSIRGLLKQLGNGPVKYRVFKLRAKLRQGHQYKAAAMKLRMRQGKPLIIDHLLAIEKQIEIDRARALVGIPRTSQQPFYSQKLFEQFFRLETCFNLYLRDHVQE